MSAAYLDSSHDNTIPMKRPLKITLELTQQETEEHKPSVSPSFLTHNSSALWGCMPLFAHPGVPLLQECGKYRGSELTQVYSGLLQYLKELCLSDKKIEHVIFTEDIFKSNQSVWQAKKRNSTFFPCSAHVAEHNTQYGGEWMCYSASSPSRA